MNDEGLYKQLERNANICFKLLGASNELAKSAGQALMIMANANKVQSKEYVILYDALIKFKKDLGDVNG